MIRLGSLRSGYSLMFFLLLISLLSFWLDWISSYLPCISIPFKNFLSFLIVCGQISFMVWWINFWSLRKWLLPSLSRIRFRLITNISKSFGKLIDSIKWLISSSDLYLLVSGVVLMVILLVVCRESWVVNLSTVIYLYRSCLLIW